LIVRANCGVGVYNQCRASITNLGGNRSYMLRFISMYQPSNLTVVAYTGGVPAAVTGAQAVIDVTGKAGDVLRRIQARVPLGFSSGPLPGFAIQSNGSLCKRFMATPGYFAVPGDIRNPDTSNNMCTQQTYGTPQPGG